METENIKTEKLDQDILKMFEVLSELMEILLEDAKNGGGTMSHKVGSLLMGLKSRKTTFEKLINEENNKDK